MVDDRPSDLEVEILCTLADTSTIGEAIDVSGAWERASKRNSSVSHITFNLAVRRLSDLGMIEDDGYENNLITEKGWQAVEKAMATKRPPSQAVEDE